MRTQILSLLCVFSLGAVAQEEESLQTYLREVMTAEDAESSTWEDVYDQLCYLSQHPFDLNTATRSQLEDLPFLSAQQIEELMDYLYHYGPMKSLGELLMIRSLDEPRRRLLACVCEVGDGPKTSFPRLKEILRDGHHELMATARIPFQQKDDAYLGSPLRHWLRYQFNDGDYLKFGLVGANDAGEPFFADRNRWGYDHYSVYLQLQGLGRLSSLCLGHYRVSLGMGLVMNTQTSFGKVALLQTLGRSQTTLRAHASRTDNYLQGAAATLRLSRHFSLTGFFSYRPMDATLNKDGTISTILTTSYHRTQGEMAKKHNFYALKTGGSLLYTYRGLQVGLNTVYAHLSRRLKPNTALLYRRHYPQGRDFFNTSLSYSYTSARWSLNGETAIDRKGHLATINSASLLLGDTWSLMALQRFYSFRYTSLDARSYSSGGRVQNESGIYFGLTWKPSPALQLMAYTDFAYYAWARYRVPVSSHAWDHLVQATWRHRHWNFFARYRLQSTDHRFRLSAEYTGTGGFSMLTQFDGCYLPDDQQAWGRVATQRFSYQYRWLTLHLGASYYHTDNYASRVYLYENAPLYTYSVMPLYGEGFRYWFLARAAIGRRLTLSAKASDTDLDLQIRWKI